MMDTAALRQRDQCHRDNAKATFTDARGSLAILCIAGCDIARNDTLPGTTVALGRVRPVFGLAQRGPRHVASWDPYREDPDHVAIDLKKGTTRAHPPFAGQKSSPSTTQWLFEANNTEDRICH
jgi:hypothetical protein